MINQSKEPSVKLIPAEPVNNTILIIYCVSGTGASVPYKACWRRLHPRSGRTEEIKLSSGSSYRCSPLDIDLVIEVTVTFQHQNMAVAKTVKSNVVKVSRQLKQKKLLFKQAIVGRTHLPQTSLDIRLAVQQSQLILQNIHPSNHTNKLILNLSDLHFETEGQQLTFRMTFKQKIQDFVAFVTPLLGRRPQLKTNDIVWQFGSELNRDILLIAIWEVLNRPLKFQPNFNISAGSHLNNQKTGKITARQKEYVRDKSVNRSQKSVSPNNGNLEKTKKHAKTFFEPMKRSFTRVANKKQDFGLPPTTPEVKPHQNINRERQFLNVFDDEDMQFLNGPILPPPNNLPKHKPSARVETQGANDGPSINLRGSFEELQKSFSSNINEDVLDKVFGDNLDASKRIYDELQICKKQNESLKKQVEMIDHLTKENNSIKKKYLQMMEEVNRLEMERKVILTDKLRCEVNWHKQIQQKQTLKREIQHMKQQTRNNAGGSQAQRSMRSHSFHEPAKRGDNKETTHSPSTSFYN